MKTDDNDKMIRAFMRENKKETEDVFFTKKVMQKLPPVQRNHEWILIPFAGLGALLAWLLGADTPVQEVVLKIPESFNIYYFIGGIAAIPLVFLTFYCLKEKRIQLL